MGEGHTSFSLREVLILRVPSLIDSYAGETRPNSKQGRGQTAVQDGNTQGKEEQQGMS